MKVVIGQLNTFVGDIKGNTEKVIQASREANTAGQDTLVVFTELTLTGYPPEDLLMRDSLQAQIEDALTRLATELPSHLYVVVGYPRRCEGALYNACLLYTSPSPRDV